MREPGDLDRRVISLDGIFSAEQLVIDNEIVQYISRILLGFGFDNESLVLEVVKEKSLSTGTI